MIGKAVEAWTNATMSTESEIVVIIQAAPTDWMSEPKLEERLASQMVLKVSCLNGASGDARFVTSSTFFLERHWRYYPVIGRAGWNSTSHGQRSTHSLCSFQLGTIKLHLGVEFLAPNSMLLERNP
jgi:hypothetical protein